MDSNKAAAHAAVHVEENEDDLRNDYYCWMCHYEGEMICCDTCPRVFHKKCLESLAISDPQSAAYLDLNINSLTEWKCHECYNLKKANEENAFLKDAKSRDQFYLMLMSAVKRLYIPNCEPFQSDVDPHMFPDYRTYIYNPMNFSIIKKKIKEKEYLSLNGLVQDVKWIVHNCIIYNGEKSKLTEVAKSLLKIVYNDVNEIESCSDCYLNYVTKKDDYWFSEPCEKPHLLVWAKTRGFPYWPGKVLRAVKGDFDIRFFGALHDRSLVQANKCYWLSKECPAYSRANNSMEFKVSIGELNKHIEKLILMYGSFNYAPLKMECDINSPFTFVDKFPGSDCLVVINDNSKSTRKRPFNNNSNSQNNNNNPTTSVSQPASPSLSTSSQSLSFNDSSSNHPTTNDAKKSRLDNSNESTSFSLDDSSNQMNSSSNNISKRSTRIRKHSDRYLNYSIETQNLRRNQIQNPNQIKSKCSESNESLTTVSIQQTDQSPLITTIQIPQIKKSESLDDSAKLNEENSINLDSSLNEDIDVENNDDDEEDEELKQKRKIKELKRIEKKLLKEKQKLEIDLNSKTSSSNLNQESNSNDAFLSNQQQPMKKPIKIKISLNQGEGSCTSSVSVSENELQTSSKQNNSTKIALNLGELVRNCKTKLGLINDNESLSGCSTPNQNKSDNNDQNQINDNSKNVAQNVENEKSNENQDVFEMIQEEEKQNNDNIINEKSNQINNKNIQRDFEIDNLRKTLEEYKKMVEIKNKDLIQIKQSFDDIVREIKWNNDLKIKEIVNECGKEKIRMQFFYENKIKDIKKRQWCANCGKEAIYYCCWNTSYCDEECQKEHWSHHLKTCNRISTPSSSLNLTNFNSDAGGISNGNGNGNGGMLGVSGQACSSGLMNYESADSSEFIISNEYGKAINNGNNPRQQANKYYSNGNNSYYDHDKSANSNITPATTTNHFRLIQPKMTNPPMSNNLNRTK